MTDTEITKGLRPWAGLLRSSGFPAEAGERHRPGPDHPPYALRCICLGARPRLQCRMPWTGADKLCEACRTVCRHMPKVEAGESSAIQRVAELLLRKYAQEYQADHLSWRDFEEDAAEIVAVVEGPSS